MKCPNCREDSRIRTKDNFCHRCGFNLKKYRESKGTWPGAILNVDEEVQGSSEVFTDFRKWRIEVIKLLDERVTEITIKKRAVDNGSAVECSSEKNCT